MMHCKKDRFLTKVSRDAIRFADWLITFCLTFVFHDFRMIYILNKHLLMTQPRDSFDGGGF